MLKKYINNILYFITKNSYNRYLIYFLSTNFITYFSTLTNDLAVIKISLLINFIIAFIGTLFFIKHTLDTKITNLFIQNILSLISICLIGLIFLINFYLNNLVINQIEDISEIKNKNSKGYTHSHKTTHSHSPDGKVIDTHTHKKNNILEINYRILIRRLTIISILYIVLVYAINKSKVP